MSIVPLYRGRHHALCTITGPLSSSFAVEKCCIQPTCDSIHIGSWSDLRSAPCSLVTRARTCCLTAAANTPRALSVSPRERTDCRCLTAANTNPVLSVSSRSVQIRLQQERFFRVRLQQERTRDTNPIQLLDPSPAGALYSGRKGRCPTRRCIGHMASHAAIPQPYRRFYIPEAERDTKRRRVVALYTTATHRASTNGSSAPVCE